jgi:hypothetical protein
MIGEKIAAMTGATGATTGATVAMTAATGAQAPGCCGDSSMPGYALD